MNQTSGPQQPQIIVPWILWFSILMGLFMVQFFVGGGIPSGPDKGAPPTTMLMICAGALLASLIVRFVILPSRKTLEQQLPLMLVGLALAEGCGFLGIFAIPSAFPQTKLWLFIAAVVGVVSHAPVYVKRESPGDRYQK
jgi:hypothetical protein